MTNEKQKGSIIIWVLFAMLAIPFLLLNLNRITNFIFKADSMSHSIENNSRLKIYRDIMLTKVDDVDDDNFYEPIKDNAEKIPSSHIVSPMDEYGTIVKYCTYDLGDLNIADTNYSSNHIVPPNANQLFAIISAGKNKVFETSCSDAKSLGDDHMEVALESQARFSHAGIGGWVDNGTNIKLLDIDDTVVLGADNAMNYKLKIISDYNQPVMALESKHNQTGIDFIDSNLVKSYIGYNEDRMLIENKDSEPIKFNISSQDILGVESDGLQFYDKTSGSMATAFDYNADHFTLKNSAFNILDFDLSTSATTLKNKLIVEGDSYTYDFQLYDPLGSAQMNIYSENNQDSDLFFGNNGKENRFVLQLDTASNFNIYSNNGGYDKLFWLDYTDGSTNVENNFHVNGGSVGDGTNNGLTVDANGNLFIDGDIYFPGKINVVSAQELDGSLLPKNDSVFNIGSSTKKWNTAYIDTIHSTTTYGNEFLYSSDKRLKKDIKTIKNALDKVSKLRGVEYKWKDNNKKQIGLIAQEVKKVFPEAVQTNEETGYMAVQYANLVAPMIEAVKDLEKKTEKTEKILFVNLFFTFFLIMIILYQLKKQKH